MGEFGEIKNSAKGEQADMIFPGEEINGLSNAIVGARPNIARLLQRP